MGNAKAIVPCGPFRNGQKQYTCSRNPVQRCRPRISGTLPDCIVIHSERMRAGPMTPLA
jgi:hypothetical protein